MRIWYLLAGHGFQSCVPPEIFFLNIIKRLGKMSVTGKSPHMFLSVPHLSWTVVQINIWDNVIIKIVFLRVGPTLNLYFCYSVLCRNTLH